MEGDGVVLTVLNGHVTSERASVYCWLHPVDGAVMFVGATWMHPAARVELHLHSSDPDARRVGHELESRGVATDQPIRIVTFTVPEGADRQQVKRRLVAALAASDLLSEDYFGEPPVPMGTDQPERYERWVRMISCTAARS